MTKVSGTRANAFWFDPATGQASSAATAPTTGTRVFTPPSPGDWVLVLDDAALGRRPPGTGSPKPLTARGTLRAVFTGNRFRVVSLRVSRLQRGSRVAVRCLRGCSVSKTYLIKAGASARELAPLFRRRLLPARTSIAIRITKPGSIGRYFRWTAKGHRIVKTRCRVSTRGTLTGCVST
jgi:hypothetical protein